MAVGFVRPRAVSLEAQMLSSLCQKPLIASNSEKWLLQICFLDLVKIIIFDYKPKLNTTLFYQKSFKFIDSSNKHFKYFYILQQISILLRNSNTWHLLTASQKIYTTIYIIYVYNICMHNCEL